MTDKVVPISDGKPKAENLSACPPDLTGRWAEAFQELADVVAVQTGMLPADVEMIATVVRAQRRAALHEALAIEALKNKNYAEFAAQSKLANSAASSVRSGLTQLKAHPAVRAGRMSKAQNGKTALAKDERWGDLL
ncbi:hypothetical protein [Ruegeria lacuscaerulensis]|uniref:hypothetical protein n=1 Tax=Ruegeria lacuscaerulensis TaxID=55218 RepID=UPI00147AA634|nr:hypothetical protein [Ruegeria lacuscaerulensis]